jgi:hypothetical protein
MYKNGGAYLPIELIKPRLTILDPSWSTRNYKHTYILDHNGIVYCSGSVDLSVKYRYPLVSNVATQQVLQWQNIDRTIVGAATFSLAEYMEGEKPNSHFAATCLSLCIVSAAKEIGKYFGMDLNKEVAVEPENKILNTLGKLPIYGGNVAK